MSSKFAYPPCEINPNTQKPYTRHRWVIKENTDHAALLRTEKGRVIYHVICKRCGLRDPNPPKY